MTLRSGRARRLQAGVCVLAAVIGGHPLLRAADPSEVQRELLEGDYASVIRAATVGLNNSQVSSEWSLLLVRALLTIGRNTEADVALREALERDQQNIRLRWLARDVSYANGRPDEAAQRASEIVRLVQGRTWNYRTPAELVVFGRAALLLGADPKDVLEKIYATAQKTDPKLRDVYLARGDLALEKHDFALAAKAFEEGLKQLPEDPDLLSGRARAYADSNREIALGSLKSALEVNARHVPTLLQFADHHIAGEAYDEAEKVLDKIVGINPAHPEAWAYRAVIAHLRNNPKAENSARVRALSSWSKNPRVDYIIGKKLSEKYRFAEGAAYQRRAREFDSTFVPAAAQLASDLLRLGEENEGWSLAHAVHERDEYDVEAYNLVTLHDTMKKYATLTNDDFVIRMSAPEVAVYGPRVMALLRRAKQTLVEKYGVELAKPTTVEIFADQRDFAVRTFGLPDVPGFLGVCFGRVVTANSPATSSGPTNWESVLWHEFCHVITLQLTRNKMPRWLSEGISVHEERHANPAWGMRMNARYRQMIMDGDLVPVGKLSAAFLAPKSSQHLQFAYLQSAMVVDFIVERFGVAALVGVLTDLRSGTEINAALAKNTVSLAELEKDFEKYARDRAKQLAPKLDWEKPEPELLMAGAAEEFAAWEKKHPDNYWALRYRAHHAAEEKKWPEARAALERLIELYPAQKGGETPYRPLVTALKAMGDTAAEDAVLKKWVEVDDEAPDAYLRLMELAAAAKDWVTVARNSERYLAVNPLVAPPYRYQAQAAAETGNDSAAVVAWRTLIQLDVPDATDAHYHLAGILHRRGEHDEARRQVLLALEETPRYREALRLLVDINRSHRGPSTPVVPGSASSVP
ncbi:MAG: tetratricopeptide repeat protein [Opitutaceae bacterium]|nr:tetratricopeptide repeat protein [Opitutaceae bacterium]